MKTSPQSNSFNAGYYSPLLIGRTDVKGYRNACRRIRNFIPTIQGPARRRPGTHFVAECINSAQRGWLARFKFNTDQVYILEFGHLKIRFFANHGVVGAPLEVVTPYTSADLTDADGRFTLRFSQSGDVMYIFHPKYQTQKLTRTGAAAFTIAGCEFIAPPFFDINPLNPITITSNALRNAACTITASAAIFWPDAANHALLVGKHIFAEQNVVDNIYAWEPGKAVVAGVLRRSDGKNYICANNGNTGTVKPIHTDGTKFDGDAGVGWTYQDSGFGFGKITAIADATHATVDNTAGVGLQWPVGVAPGPTPRWAFENFGYYLSNYPSHGTFFRERLVLARGRDMFGSVASDFENFADRDDGGIVTADMAFKVTTLNDNSDDIVWIVPSNKALLFGTRSDENALREMNQSDPFGPGNIMAARQSANGSANVMPEVIADSIIFVQRTGKKVREMRIAESVDERWESIDLTALAEDITTSGVLQIAYQQDPDSVLWCAMGDGRLVGMTMSRENEVRGWHEHRLGGFASTQQGTYAAVESVAVIPGPNGQDELWMIVRREINGGTKRYVEYMGTHFNERVDDPQDAYYVDCGLTLNSTQADTLTPGAGAMNNGTDNVIFTRGAALFSALDVGRYIHYDFIIHDVDGSIAYQRAAALITAFTDATHVKATITEYFPNMNIIAGGQWRMSSSTFAGMNHLIGQQVQVFADGDCFDTFVPNSGTVGINVQASKVAIGLKCPAALQPMPIEPQGAIGSTMTKKKRTNRIGIRFLNARGTKYGREETAPPELQTIPNDITGKLLFTGDVIVPFPDGYEQLMLVTILQDTPYPCTVIGIVTNTDTSEDV